MGLKWAGLKIFRANGLGQRI